jgi:hypothetical protein
MTEATNSDSALDASEDSSSDSKISSASPEQIIPSYDNAIPIETTVAQTPFAGNDGDDASDVSMTEDSDDDSEDGSHRASLIVTQQSFQTTQYAHDKLDPSKKRKFSNDGDNTPSDQSWPTAQGEEHKRIKLDIGLDLALKNCRTIEDLIPSDRSLLPAEIWHHIFIFTPPRALGRLLQVNKLFRGYLDSSYSTSSPIIAPLSLSVARTQSPDALWQASRRTFRSTMPSPLQNHSELDMWKLACTPKCQFCDRQGQEILPSADKWHSGPGENGVSPIWPFAIRSCGSCLQKNCVKVGCLSI